MSVQQVELRLDALDLLLENESIAMRLRRLLRECYDMDRCVQRVLMNRGSPRDLSRIAETLRVASEVATSLENISPTVALAECCDRLTGGSVNLKDLSEKLSNALCSDPPFLVSSGGFIRDGYCSTLDYWREIKSYGGFDVADSESQPSDNLLALEERYKKSTKINALRIRHGPRVGYYVDVPSKFQVEMIGMHSRRFDQNLMLQLYISTAKCLNLCHSGHGFTQCYAGKNRVRYQTPELNDLDMKLRQASVKVFLLFNNVSTQVEKQNARSKNWNSCIFKTCVSLCPKILKILELHQMQYHVWTYFNPMRR